DHYSLSGLSPVSISAMLLLCGEGDLQLVDVAAGDSGAGDEEDEGRLEAAVSDDAFSKWWATANIASKDGGGGGSSASTKPASGTSKAQPTNGEPEVIVSISELGDWFQVRVRRETAARFQGLRAMLRLLFRVFCSEPSRWEEMISEGQVGAIVLDLVAKMIRAEATGSEEAAAAPRGAQGRPTQSARPQKAPHSASQAARGGGGYSAGHGRSSGGAQQAPKASAAANGSSEQWRRCDVCAKEVVEASGSSDNSSGQWYCFNCWQVWFAQQQAQTAAGQHQHRPQRTWRG
ncbi:unnamed protein product, partial [Polarella glacialis]